MSDEGEADGPEGAWTVGGTVDDATGSVDPELRGSLRADALATLEAVETAHGPGARRERGTFGPRGHDPDEPPTTAAAQRDLLAGIAGTVVVDGRAAAPARPRVALVRRTYADGWVSPGGVVERDEPLPAAAVRETEEETGLTVELTGLCYTRLVEHRYADGGSLPVPMAVFAARATGGSLDDRPARRLPDGRPELAAVDWFPVEDLPADTVDRERIRDRFAD